MRLDEKHIKMIEGGDWSLRTEAIENTEDITTIQEHEYTERNWFLPDFLRFHWLPTFCERTRRESYEAKAPNRRSQPSSSYGGRGLRDRSRL